MGKYIFRKRVIKSIEEAIIDYKDASDVNHPGMTGGIREKVVKTLFEPLLPAIFSAKTNAKVIDQFGTMSNEIDLIIYSKNILPPVMFAEEETLFPAESCFFAIEIKSMANATEVKKSYNKLKKLKEIKYQSGKYTYTGDVALPHGINPIVPTFFAFDSDLSNKTEIERYKEIDPDYEINPILRAICVIGKGCWAFSSSDKKWLYRKPTSIYDEVIFFLSITINTLHKSFTTRGYPRLGTYLELKKFREVKE